MDTLLGKWGMWLIHNPIDGQAILSVVDELNDNADVARGYLATRMSQELNVDIGEALTVLERAGYC